MMNNEQYIQLVEMLKQATEKGLLKWELDTSNRVFYTDINGCRINLDVYYDSSLKDNSAMLELFNGDGASFKTFLYTDLMEHAEYERLNRLYEKVKDRYYRISESEESIIKGLTDLLSK